MNFSPMPTYVWNLPMSEPNSIRPLTLTSNTTGRSSKFPVPA